MWSVVEDEGSWVRTPVLSASNRGRGIAPAIRTLQRATSFHCQRRSRRRPRGRRQMLHPEWSGGELPVSSGLMSPALVTLPSQEKHGSGRLNWWPIALHASCQMAPENSPAAAFTRHDSGWSNTAQVRSASAPLSSSRSGTSRRWPIYPRMRQSSLGLSFDLRQSLRGNSSMLIRSTTVCGLTLEGYLSTFTMSFNPSRSFKLPVLGPTARACRSQCSPRQNHPPQTKLTALPPWPAFASPADPPASSRQYGSPRDTRSLH